MKLKRMTPHSLTYILSLALGLLLLVIIMLLFLRFANGNMWVALSLAFMSTLALSLLLGWVDVQEEEDKKSHESRMRELKRRKL